MQPLPKQQRLLISSAAAVLYMLDYLPAAKRTFKVSRSKPKLH